MKTVREFYPDAERYLFDFKLCTFKKGYAQLDTDQDAWYFGTWANPEKLIIVSYAEGDCTIQYADSKEEFIKEINKWVEWNNENGFSPVRIDPGLNEGLIKRFKSLGLGNLLH